MTVAARLDLRLNLTDKDRITRAAKLRGMTLSAFVRDAVLRESDNVMTAELTVTLSAKESRRFLAALDEPFKPYARLKKAMADAEKLTTEGAKRGKDKENGGNYVWRKSGRINCLRPFCCVLQGGRTRTLPFV